MRLTEQVRRDEALIAVYTQLSNGAKPEGIDAGLQLALIGASKVRDRLRYEYMLDALDEVTP